MGSLLLQPIQASDESFLRAVYATTREDELAQTGWDAQTMERFLRMQFDAQHAHYIGHYPQARFDLIVDAGVPVGRLYVDRTDTQVHVIDISLLPAYRGRGMGTALFNALQQEAARDGKTVTIHVEVNNPAQRLYQRLGFQEMSVSGFHRMMEWAPAGPTTQH
ncbi:MAG: GNAT family N-acetyltransferase [Massilia sp.]